MNPGQPNGTGTFLLFDGSEAASGSSNLQALLDMLPIGLALVDRLRAPAEGCSPAVPGGTPA